MSTTRIGSSNPRATEQLRAESALTPAVELARASSSRASTLTYRFIVEAIG